MRFNFEQAYARAEELTNERAKLRSMTADEDKRHETPATIIDGVFGFGLDARHVMVSVEDSSIVLDYADREKKAEDCYLHKS
jgi:NAD(P)H-hydrate repair Nnr-like enzyme with NAD(P)H-hydrate epimerase domain